AAVQDERDDITDTVLKTRLRSAIKRLNPWINENNLEKVFNRITTVVGTSVMEINQEIWETIRGGTITVKQRIGASEDFYPVHFIDYQDHTNNDFLVINQIKYHGKYQHSVPDIMVYLNGMPIAVIECKSPTAQNAWDKAFYDLKYYQENSEKLFHFNQICVGLWKDGGRYGAIGSPQQFYSVYRPHKGEDLTFLGPNPTAQDILLYSIFKKERILDIIRHFVIFELDEGSVIKKLPRYQQLRATNKTITR
ncbi:type I restriction endonuclease, partial [Salinimicrobium oceani]